MRLLERATIMVQALHDQTNIHVLLLKYSLKKQQKNWHLHDSIFFIAQKVNTTFFNGSISVFLP